MSFGDFLRDAMDRAGVTNAQLAAHFGVSSQAISQWRAGATRPSSSRIEQVREYLVDMIGSREGIASCAPDLPDLETDPPPSYLPIPTFDIRAGAGGGGIVDRAFLGSPRYFEAGFVTQELRARPEDLCLIEIEGQSMEPLLRHGDTVIVDRRKINIAMEGIFVLFDGDGVVCKWAERVHGSEEPTIRLKSENPRFSDYEVPASICKIVGRVVWFSRRL